MSGPFAYLQNHILPDIREAESAGFSSEGIFQGRILGETGGVDVTSCDISIKLLYSSIWDVRARALEAMAVGALWQEEYVRGAFNLAFDDPDARVRGVAWLVVASAWREPRNHAIILSLTVHAFVDRFRMLDEFRDQAKSGACHWLTALSREAERPRHQRALANVRRACLEHVVGIEASTIDSLKMDEAAQLLSDADAARRIASLLVLSRARQDAVKYVASVKECATGDRDPRVRSAAVQALGQIYRASSDVAIERLLAEIALDEEQPSHTRYLACHALLIVRGVRYSEWPIRRARLRSEEDFRMLGKLFQYESAEGVDWSIDVDWEFVKECAGSGV